MSALAFHRHQLQNLPRLLQQHQAVALQHNPVSYPTTLITIRQYLEMSAGLSWTSLELSHQRTSCLGIRKHPPILVHDKVNLRMHHRAAGSDCQHLFLGYYYCVGVPGSPTTRPTTSATPTLTPTRPSPTQSGIVSNCNKYYKVSDGDSGQGIVDKHGTFSLSSFTRGTHQLAVTASIFSSDSK